MKKYNIYYNNNKINTKLLDKSELDDIFKHTEIFKSVNGKLTKIPVKSIRSIECTII